MIEDLHFTLFETYREKVNGKYFFFFFKQKTAYEIGLGIPAEPLFRSTLTFSSASVRTSVFPARTRKVNANNSAALTGRSTPLIMFSVNSAPSMMRQAV